MPIPRHTLLLTAALTLLAGCDALSNQPEREARMELAHYRGWMEAQADSADEEMRSIGNPLTGRLRQGEERLIPLEVTGARRAMVIAACDARCDDLDLRVVTEDGRLIDLDEEPDGQPLVSIARRKPEKLNLRVRMAGCDARACAFAVAQYEYADFPGSIGTCFAVSPGGLLMTSFHVIDEAKQIQVSFPDGRQGKATVLRHSKDNDLALLRTEVPTPVWLPLGGASDIVVGMPAFTLGFPATGKLGAEIKFAEGHVAALSGYKGETTLLQVYMPIQHGNSGGPVLSHAGRVVGIAESGVDKDDNGNAPAWRRCCCRRR